GDGSEWSVTPDWEEREGMKHDIFGVEEDEAMTAIRDRFKDDPWFLEVVDYLLGNMKKLSVRERRRLYHKAAGFWLEDGKLWKGTTRATDRSAKVECIPGTEGLLKAREVHRNNGHFAWDHTRLHLQDYYFWPTL
ncbi:hypothetical protein M422DRAFT_84382, partial [Sphaerobolus stellatus SS14]